MGALKNGDVFRRSFLPCCYGYSTTIRRAQGSTVDLGALYFDHCYPPDCGYGYVAASRFRSADGIYLYGRIRRTDFLPVLAKRRDLKEQFQYFRSVLSEPDEDTMMDGAAERSFERFAALHAQAALSEGETADADLCVDFSDCDSQEEDLEEPSMSHDVMVEPTSAVEQDGAGSAIEDFLFEF